MRLLDAACTVRVFSSSKRLAQVRRVQHSIRMFSGRAYLLPDRPESIRIECLPLSLRIVACHRAPLIKRQAPAAT